MGCWNGTDNLGGLPIRWGDKVKVHIIQMNSFQTDASGFCYLDGIASPISLTIDGTYDDYGSVEGIDEDSIPVIMLRRYLEKLYKNGKLEITKDKYDSEFKGFENIKMQQFIKEFIERDRVYIKGRNYKGEDTRDMIGIMFSSSTMFDKIYGAIVNDTSSYENENVSNDVIDVDAQYFVEDILADDEDRRLFGTWDSDVRKVGQWYNSVSIFRHDYVNSDAFRDMFFSLEKYKDRKEELAQALAEMVKMITVMNRTRKSWGPGPGKGGQDCDIESFMGMIEGIAQQIIDYHSEDEVGEWECIYSLDTFVKGETYLLEIEVQIGKGVLYKVSKDGEYITSLDKETKDLVFGEY